MTKFKFTSKQETWLKALESGDYQQCRFKLHSRTADGEAHCCLGVAARVLNLHEQNMEVLHNSFHELGLFSQAGVFKNHSKIKFDNKWYGSLVGMNDGASFRQENGEFYSTNGKEFALTFAQIAKAIRDNPELVFQAPSRSS